MSTADQHTKAPEGATFHVSSIVVNPRPDEVGFPLREDEFQILCDGNISEARANRDLCIGAFVGAVLGLAGLFASTDWGTIWQQQHTRWFLVSFIFLLLIVGGCGAGWWIFQRALTRTTSDSPYSRLRKRISESFRATPS
jgi:hypothetical protein